MKSNQKPVTVEGLQAERMRLKYELELSKLRFEQQKEKVKEEFDPENLYRDLIGKTLLFAQTKLINGAISALRAWMKK